MTDLEDTILKKNVPGKYSRWDDYDDNRTENFSDDDNDDNDTAAFDDLAQVRKWDTSEDHHLPKPLQMTALASRHRHNTGAKGVMNDYNDAKDFERQQALLKRQEEQELINRMAVGARLDSGEVSMSATAIAERHRLSKTIDNSNSNSDDDDDDDEFMTLYRQKRLQQLRQTTQYPLYGTPLEVDPHQYSEIIDATDPRVPVVTHLYEPFVTACRALNALWEELARDNMPYARFLRLRATAAKRDFDPVGLPALIVYKGGVLVRSWTRVTDYLPEGFTTEDVRELLESVGVVDPYSVEVGVVGEERGGDGRIRGGVVEGGDDEKSALKTGNIRITRLACDEGSDFDSDAELDEFCSDFVSHD